MASKSIYATPLFSNSATALEELGAVRREYDATHGWRTFKYVQVTTATTGANGKPLAWYDAKGTVATSDISTSSINQPAGVCICPITASYYGWIQIGGNHSAVITNGDDDISDGDTIIYGADGVVNSVAAGTASTYKPLGIAVTADVDASDTVSVQLDCTYGDIIQ